jgi:exoribonuclease R
MPFSYQVTIHDRAYSKWTFTSDEDGTIVEHPRIHPIYKKLFSKDVFMYDPTEEDFLSVVYSPVRDGTSIPGILILENNKTYGRTSSKKRLLYKCIPNDSQLPAFLIPYEVQLGFSKTYVNKYVLFKFDHWNDNHPQGILLETLGDVNQLEVYYEYQLHCKHVHSSITHFTNKTREQIKTMDDAIHTKIMDNPNFHIENRLFDKYIFTIDPAGSTDFDDAFSFTTDSKNDTSVLSIYIANVYVWLEQLKLWQFFSDRVSTIYLPDKKRTMLPTILSENLCSLKAGEHRFALVMEIQIDDTGKMTHTFKSSMIKVKQNYVYESDPLLANIHYKSLFKFTQKINPDVKDSHDLVAHWMVYFNTECAKYMAKNGIGIQRTIEKKPFVEDSLQQFLSDTHLTGKYNLFDIDMDSLCSTTFYAHVTSPIRRLVDLLNQICIMHSMRLVDSISSDCLIFTRNWMYRISRINENMRNIRKVQNTCELLYKCTTISGILDSEHTGILFDKKRKNSHTNVHEDIECFTYSVYLEDLKLISKMQSYKEYSVGEKYRFKLYVFHNEYKQKIRVQMVSH